MILRNSGLCENIFHVEIEEKQIEEKQTAGNCRSRRNNRNSERTGSI